MNFTLTEDQRAIQGMARDIARSGKEPSWEELGELGLCGITAPEALGGIGLGLVETCLCLEELASTYASVARLLQVHNLLCVDAICSVGTEAQKERWVAKLVSGQAVGSYSDDGAATPAGASAAVVLVGSALYEGPIPATAVQLHGFRGIAAADLDLSNAVGEPLTAAPDRARMRGTIGLAAIAVGIGRAALEHATRYASERKQFGQPIANFQAIQWKIADAATRLDAARLMTYRAAWQADNGYESGACAAMAKRFAADAALKTSDDAIQIHGGYGYTTDFPVEALYRDARACVASGGTASFHRDTIAQSALANV